MLFSQESPRPFLAAPCRDMSIETLQLLTAQIIAHIQTLVSPPLPDIKRSDLLGSLYTAFGQGLSIVGGLLNAAAPINRIPPELLATIFALSPGRYSPGSQLPYWPFLEPRVDDLHKFPKVCRYWRELALGTPTLWNYVVTMPHSHGRDPCFGRSIYLPGDTSANLNVHFNPRAQSKDSVEKMIEFMQMNAPRIRELHAWDASSIEDLPQFLESFDANALEHCTISQKVLFERPIGISYPPGRRMFFSNGGARLRSLCVNNLQFLPENAFPALTLLKIGFLRRQSTSLYWGIEDLVKFLAGSPKLEEVYVHDMPYSERSMWDKSPPVPLPRLQYLAFTYTLEVPSPDPTHPTELLLARISVPPACHMFLPAPSSKEQTATTDDAASILTSVVRHVPGKDTVSHVLLQLCGFVTTLQLVFRPGHGSLRIQVPTPSPSSYRDARGSGSVEEFPSGYEGVFHTFPQLLASADDLRVLYDSNLGAASLSSGPFPLAAAAVFPNLRALSVIRIIDPWFSAPLNPSLAVGLALLAQPQPQPPESESAGGAVTAPLPVLFPELDTLWTSVEASKEITVLERALAARAALGCPIRCLVVTLRYVPPAGANDVARLRALGAEEVIVMGADSEAEAEGALWEADWLVGLPERYGLPACIHRDWPTVWGKQSVVRRG
ncbi:hypothetical protein GSI_07733 [Ganoderma sinense ZZ0214-1]|uniref:Uncharacterized protein n=1 Tax=Ganoderma sinense ZZ0214-1 TaxID=1077348 RepID=A0A2G8S8P7_9APHY|nr:hypothetical protein GSI_07702 [Ganoderma sinense ZZ0214-1]PIL30155.1 hypothetical protein GSI_07733 [Ganoderma sinense ZZ0214-1]